ncbi:MAG: hypothetical protein QOC81_3483 [Thermoanaerobaculia bacterium]|jgi:hypothetical protein|nr:hypothetical protein [Thermoanaerobaculia bacterium]
MSTTNISEQLVALHTISSLSLDPGFPLFRHYSALKLGVRESVRFYASFLIPLAAKIIASQPETKRWVVTSPPLYVVPSAANLLAWEMARALAEQVPPQVSVRAVDLRYSFPDPQNAGEVRREGEYSSSPVEARIRNRQRLHEGKWAPRPDPADFRDRAVLFINDINVTGTQQRFVRQTLETVHPASIDWLYIIQVEPELGHSHPEIERALNRLNLETFEDFAEVFSREDIDDTARGILRLFECSFDQFGVLVRSLDESRRSRLYRMIVEEGSYSGDEHKTKLALLAGTFA